MTPSELDARYPYDPSTVSENLRGLEKLRAVADRSLAMWLYELYEANHQTRPQAPRAALTQRATPYQHEVTAEPDGKSRQAGDGR
jgi:hypothetical protein